MKEAKPNGINTLVTLEQSKLFGQTGFIFGTSTSSYQIEGATDKDGRCPSIWDVFCARQGNIADGSDGSTACDHYRLWEDDLTLMKDLGVDAYRFSVSWPRLIDASAKINQKGVDFYRRILETLKKLEIKAFINLYHWDLPQYLEERGGWTNRDIVGRFAELAETCGKYFGDLTDGWSTFNEPFCQAYLGYGVGIHAPGKKDLYACFAAGHYQLLAHAEAVKALKSRTPASDVGIILNVTPGIAFSASAPDREATQRWNELNVDWFFSPLLKKKYTDHFIRCWGKYLPKIEADDFEKIGTPIDYIGINYYTVERISDKAGNDFKVERPDSVDRTDMGWEINPEAFYRVLTTLLADYPNLPKKLFISENGMANPDVPDASGRVNDVKRIEYIKSHLEAVNRAIQDGVNICGYFVWSLLDNFEWSEGYSKRFGLYYVDYKTLQRSPKESARWFKQFLGDLKNR